MEVGEFFRQTKKTSGLEDTMALYRVVSRLEQMHDAEVRYQGKLERKVPVQITLENYLEQKPV